MLTSLSEKIIISNMVEMHQEIDFAVHISNVIIDISYSKRLKMHSSEGEAIFSLYLSENRIVICALVFCQ